MPAESRTKTPPPRGSGKVEDEIFRGKCRTREGGKPTRPISEFGGKLGCLIWTLFFPGATWYLYGIVVLNEGQLMKPNKEFWHKLYYSLPEGLAIRPTWEATGAYALWVLFQALMEMFIPCNIKFCGIIITSVEEGAKLKNGRRLLYPMNGLVAFFLSHAVVYALCYYEYFDPAYAFKQMGALLTGGVILSTVTACWMYIDFGIFWHRHVYDPEFEEDWGVFHFSECINDWWLGVARNPRILHNWLRIPFDVKRFSNARVGLTIWVILNQSYVAAMYYNCRLEDKGVNGIGTLEVKCDHDGTWDNVGFAAIWITLAHWYYILDYNLNEAAYLTTTDICHEQYGWMLSYGCCGFLAWYYSFSFLGHLAFQKEGRKVMGPPHGPGNDLSTVAGVIIYGSGMFLFRVADLEKRKFRSYIAEGKDLKEYKVWGKPVTYIRTEEGTYLLTSGYWGLARHFNYIGDMVMCLGWAVTCSGPELNIPWAPISFVIYFCLMDVHRLCRDENRCSIKYKKDWEEYKKAVPCFIVPGLF